MKIVGYSDRWSVQPGERLRFMVSTELRSYRADIVRLIHGDDTPGGPGFKDEPIETPVSGEYPGRQQPIRKGSYVTVPDSPALRLTGSFTLQAWIYPTTPKKGVQGILTKWGAGRGRIRPVHRRDGRGGSLALRRRRRGPARRDGRAAQLAPVALRGRDLRLGERPRVGPPRAGRDVAQRRVEVRSIGLDRRSETGTQRPAPPHGRPLGARGAGRVGCGRALQRENRQSDHFRPGAGSREGWKRCGGAPRSGRRTTLSRRRGTSAGIFRPTGSRTPPPTDWTGVPSTCRRGL